jgi:putative ATPase
MANPAALQLATSAAQAVNIIGMPEARIILSQAAVMVATSPKSNSCYAAINKALEDVSKRNTGEVPMHLRNAVTSGMKDLGYGKGYKYAHDFPGNIVDQEYLPDEMRGTVYYNPTGNGYELKIKDWLEKRRK